MKEIIIYTDGSSKGNPGPGGWGSIVFLPNDAVSELGGSEGDTTNNRMELKAAFEALLMIERKGASEGDIIVHTDSAYLINGITKWVYGWERKNWFTAAGEPVLNQDLWAALLEVVRRLKLAHEIIWKKVAGHAGVAGNERCDTIATSFAEKKLVLLFSGAVSQYEKMLGDVVFSKGGAHIAAAGKNVKSKKARTGAGYSYVSLIDGAVHVDKTWKECESRVKGKKGVKYKKAMNPNEEKELIAKYEG